MVKAARPNVRLETVDVKVGAGRYRCAVSTNDDAKYLCVVRYGYLLTHTGLRSLLLDTARTPDVRVVGIPTPGFGCNPIEAPWGPDALADFQSACLDRLEGMGIGEPNKPRILVGYSAGGPLQLWSAEREPERVAAIQGINIVGRPLTLWNEAVGALSLAAGAMPRLDLARDQDIVRASFDVVFSAMSPQRALAAKFFWRHVNTTETEDAIRREGIPVSLIHAKLDQVADRRVFVDQVARLGAEGIVVPGDHWVGCQYTDEVAFHNRRFLQRAVAVAAAMEEEPGVDRRQVFDRATVELSREGAQRGQHFAGPEFAQALGSISA